MIGGVDGRMMFGLKEPLSDLMEGLRGGDSGGADVDLARSISGKERTSRSDGGRGSLPVNICHACLKGGWNVRKQKLFYNF